MPLGPQQREVLGDLVGIPSHGENECAILERIEEYFRGSDCQVRRIPIADDPHHRWNLVVEKGNGEKNVLLSGHVDTFTPRWKNVDFRLQKNDGRLHGPGVYDMKAGVMEMIDLLLHTPVPSGMKFVAVFSPDEELHSRGAADTELQSAMKSHDFVAGFSPEISVVDGHDSDDPKQIVVARRGLMKGEFTLETAQGHGAKPSRNAVQLYQKLSNTLNGIARAHMPRYMNARSSVDVAGIHIPEALDLSQPFRGVLSVKCFLAPPMTVEEALHVLQTQTKHLAGVSLSKMPHVRSYDPYSINIETPLSQAILNTAASVYGKYRCITDDSPSDGNVWVPWLQSRGNGMPWIESSALGGGEHSPKEWVDEESIVRHLRFLREALTRAIPDSLSRS